MLCVHVRYVPTNVCLTTVMQWMDCTVIDKHELKNIIFGSCLFSGCSTSMKKRMNELLRINSMQDQNLVATHSHRF